MIIIAASICQLQPINGCMTYNIYLHYNKSDHGSILVCMHNYNLSEMTVRMVFRIASQLTPIAIDTAEVAGRCSVPFVLWVCLTINLHTIEIIVT